jgi:hypothetical protein
MSIVFSALLPIFVCIIIADFHSCGAGIKVLPTKEILDALKKAASSDPPLFPSFVLAPE